MSRLALLLYILVGCGLALGQTTGPQDCFLGEIRLFAGNFAPTNWALAQGQLVAINQLPSLFSVLGTTYGGDGRLTFALPDLRGRVPVGTGQGPGLTNRTLAATGGQEQVTLGVSQLPVHRHKLFAVSGTADTTSPAGNSLAVPTSKIYSTSVPGAAMNTVAIGLSGGGKPHPNMPPFLGLNYIICVSGSAVPTASTR